MPSSLRSTVACCSSTCALGAFVVLAAGGGAAHADTLTATNPGAFSIPMVGPATPYPSVVAVVGLSGVVTHVALTLHGLTHTCPTDLDLLLVAPSGESLLFMSDCGEAFDVSGITLAFDDNAPIGLPFITGITSGVYRPTNYDDSPSSGSDAFPPPAPPASGATTLATFNGVNPNGNWSLFVSDDLGFDSGTIAGGWSLTVTTNDGTVSCFSSTPYAVGAEPSSVVMADLNGDGLNDLAVANHDAGLDNRISVLINNGDGTFAPAVYYDAGDRPYWIAHGDIDGDLDLDLAVTNYFDTTVSVFLNNGAGTFAPQVTYDMGNGPGFVVFAPLDGDADLDMAATNIGDDTVSVFMNNGDGTFAAQVTYPAGPGPYGLTAADLDNDGWRDLTISNHHSNTISVLMNNADGTFAPPTAYTVHAGPVGNDAGDLNGDGFRDIVVANTGQGVTGTTVSVLINNGNGTFAAHAPYPAAVGPYTIRIADFDADGDGDIATSHESGFASVMLNFGNGIFGPAANFPLGLQPIGLDVGDLDGNGTPEVAISSYGDNQVWVLFNEFAGITQQPASQSIEEGQPATFTVIAGGPGPFTYQWRRNGVDLIDGGAISGAQTPTLTIDPVSMRDAGDYDVIVANDCGSEQSDAATLDVVTPTCDADCAPPPVGDGVVNVTDLLAVIGSWGTCGPPCAPDINDDGSVNVTDLLAVIGAWGACP